MHCRQEIEEALGEISVLMVFDFLDQGWQLLSLQDHTVNIIGHACSLTIAPLHPCKHKAARDRAPMNGPGFVPVELFTKQLDSVGRLWFVNLRF